MLCITDNLPYEFFKTRRGGFLLMFNGYTYSKRNQSRNYYCSKKDQGCRAGVRINENGTLVVKNKAMHNHLPPKYHVTGSGIYVKL